LTISTTYSTKSVADLTFVPLGSNTLNDISIYKCKKNSSWGEWNKVTQSQTDTGWVPYNTINGVEKDTMFKNGTDNGFDCAYRIIKQGDITTRKLRVNARNLTNGVTFAELPSAFAKNYQKFIVATPRNRNSGIIDITPTGELKFNYYYNTTEWTETDYIYGEFTWHD